MLTTLMLAATLCAGGKSDYAILAGTNVQERIAADELQEIFERTTGVRLPIFIAGEQSNNPNNRTIQQFVYVGYTPEAEKVFGKDDLGENEYAVTEKRPTLGLFGGGDIWLRGTAWNGTMQAVYTFCEDVLGYRFFFPLADGERIVKTDAVKTDGLDVRRKDAFTDGRTLCMTYLYPTNVIEYCLRNFSSVPDYRYDRTRRYKGLSSPFPGKDSGHGFCLYMPCKRHGMGLYEWDEKIDFFALHPEWFSMDASGKRVDTMQLCFSNKELRKTFIKRVLERCRRVGGEGVLTVGANDVPRAFCLCPACKELAKKYETPAGPYWDFLPELCEAVAAAYPKILISTLAYRKEQSENFPKGIERFPDNFIVDFAPVDDNQAFCIGGTGNEKTLSNLEKWGKACKRVGYWYYACTTDQPYGPVSRVAGDLRTIKKAGATAPHLCGMYSPGLCNMLDYLFLRLAKEPSRDEWSIVKEYCDFAYGAASETVQDVIRDLDKLWFEKNPFVGIDVGPGAMTVYKGKDLVRWQIALEAAAAKVSGDARAKRMLGWFRWDIDFLTLTFWKDVVAVKDRPAFLTADAIHGRMMATELFVAQRSSPAKKNQEAKGNHAKAEALYLLTKAVGKPLPEPLASLPKDVTVHCLPQCGGFMGKLDPDALCGAAKTEGLPTNLTYKTYTEHKVGYDYYDTNRKRMIRHGELDISKCTPGKYEMYDLGKVKIVPGSLITFASWWGIGQTLTNYYPEGDADREFELWASLKFVGPYWGIPTTDGRNRMFCDAIYLVDRNGKKYKGE